MTIKRYNGISIGFHDDKEKEVIEYLKELNIAPNLLYYPEDSSYNYILTWKLEKSIKEIDYKRFMKVFMKRCLPEGEEVNLSIEEKTHQKTADYNILYNQRLNGANFGENENTRQKTPDYNILYNRGLNGRDFGEKLLLISEKPASLAHLGFVEILCRTLEGQKPKAVNELSTGLIKYYKEVSGKTPHMITNVPYNWVDRVKERCKLLKKWTKKEPISDMQLLMLICNVRYLRKKDHKESIINDFLEYFDESVCGLSEEEIRALFRNRSLVPRCKIVHSPEYDLSIPDFFNEHHDTIVPLDQEWKCSLEELDKWMDDNLVPLMRNNPLLYFKSQTASGKTHRIINFYKEEYENGTLGKQILAVPTHTLAKEVEERLRSAAPGIPVYRVPEITDYTERELIRMYAGLSAHHTNQERAEILSLLLEDEEAVGVFVLTHSMLIHLEKAVGSADRIIIDENIEEALITNITLDRSELAFLSSYCGYVPDASNLRQAVQYIYDNCLEEYLRGKVQIPSLFSILKSEFVKPTRDGGARALVRAPLITSAIENNVPIALFTATPLSVLLKVYYGYEFVIAEAPFAKNTGTITQYCGVTGARGNNNDRLQSYVEYVDSKVDSRTKEESLLISFMGSERMWEHAGFTVATIDDKKVHLRNNVGLDCFRGRNLIIVGKFDLPNDYYLNLWEDIGDKSIEPHRINQTIEHNNVKQTLYLWDVPILREQQLEYMEYATAQAVGRARSLRKDADVMLFSNYVINDVDTVIYD